VLIDDLVNTLCIIRTVYHTVNNIVNMHYCNISTNLSDDLSTTIIFSSHFRKPVGGLVLFEQYKTAFITKHDVCMNKVRSRLD